MKLPFSLLFLSALPLYAGSTSTQTAAASVLSADKQQLLPLPPFHESWTPEEVQCLNRFAAEFHRLCQDELLPQPNNQEIARIARYLHEVVETGQVKPSYANPQQPDTLARLAAMVDNFEAVKLFITKGEDPNVINREKGFVTDLCLAQEIIFSESLNIIHHSAAERVEMLEWLKTQGWNPQANRDSVIFAVCVASFAEHRDILPLFEWLNQQGFEQDALLTQQYKEAALRGVGATPIVRQLVEAGHLPLNEPLGDLLPLQHLCTHPLLDKIVNLDTLQYLLEAGADPNLMLADDTTEHPDTEYRQEDFDEEDRPLEDMVSYATPIELMFDIYRFDSVHANETETDRKRIISYLAAIDLLLLHGAELEIEEDEAGDEDAESAAYAEVRKRLRMSPEQLRADYEALYHSL